MDRLTRTALLSILVAAGHAAFAADRPHCDVPTPGNVAANTPIRSHAQLEAWLSRCPSPLDALPAAALQRFMYQLQFNERGVVDYPVGELTEALTTDEIGQVSRLLGLDMVITGLRPEEAARLRAYGRPAGITMIEQRFGRFHRAFITLERELEGTTRGAAMARLYHSHFPSGISSKAEGNDDLGLLYRAASSTTTYSKDPEILEVTRDAYARLSRQGLDTRARAMDMMELLLGMDRMDDARALAVAAPEHDLPLLPPTRDETSNRHDTSVWDLDVPDALVRRHISLSPERIVVRASLGCRFSLAAAEAIAADPELGPLFREHAVWLAAPAELIGYEHLRAWNREHPDTPLVVAANTADWPEIEWELTPTFHIFRDDELLDSVTSWPIEEGNRDAVVNALRKAGLL